jgi:hypothetical protein
MSTGILYKLMSLIVTIIVALTNVVRADVSKIERKEPLLDIWIQGPITAQDARQFQALEPELARSSVRVYLNSHGGSVAAAITIGKLIRKYDGKTSIAVPGKCYSSCALIFISGVERLNLGELGLHRPYLADAPQSREALEKRVPLMLATVKSYVAEMGVMDFFYQQMVNTEPSKMLRYDFETYTTVVPEIDPVYDEVIVSRKAQEIGVNTDEYRRRKSRYDVCFREALLQRPNEFPKCRCVMAGGRARRPGASQVKEFIGV